MIDPLDFLLPLSGDKLPSAGAKMIDPLLLLGLHTVISIPSGILRGGEKHKPSEQLTTYI